MFPLLPEIVDMHHAEFVSVFRQMIIFASYADGTKSMSSHKTSASATKLYRNIVTPDALCGNSGQLVCVRVASVSCIYLGAQLFVCATKPIVPLLICST